MSSAMNRFGKQLSAGTQHLAQQAVTVAQAAGASIVAGLRTCDERSGGLNQFEIRIEDDPNNRNSKTHSSTPSSSFSKDALFSSVSIPSTAMTLPTTDAQNPREGFVWGSHTFDFSFRLADSGPSAGCLVASARRSGSSDSLSIRCRWKRKIGDHCFEISGVFGTVYPISADDIASKIVVEATTSDPHFKGTAYAELGPFDIDPATRKNLDNYLAVGSMRFPIRMSNSPDDSRLSGISSIDRDDNLSLHISTEEVKVVQPGPLNVGYLREWSCRFGSDYPYIQLNCHNPTSFELTLGPEPQDLLHLSTITRNQRDLLALTIRCFHGRQWVLNSALLQTVGLAANRRVLSNDVEPLDILTLVQSLNSQLYKSIEKQEKCIKERDRAQTEKDALEEDISATIETYQHLLSQFSSSEDANNSSSAKTIALDISHRAAHMAELESKLKEAKLQSEKYIEELEMVRRDFRALQSKVASSTTADVSPKDSLFMTNSKFMDVSGSRFGFTRKGMMDTSLRQTPLGQDTFQTVELRQHLEDLQQAHVKLLEDNERKGKELETMRISGKTDQSINGIIRHDEIDAITKEKASLERQLRTLQSENKELTDNFIYIKSKFDAIKSSQTQNADRLAHSAELSQQAIEEATQTNQCLEQKLKDLQQQVHSTKSKYDSVVADKNRLTKKCETLSREFERYKSQLENKTQMLMTVNQKLSDEKSTAQEQIKKLESTMTDHKGSLLETSVRSDLQQQLIEKNSEIERLEKENQQLRSRIRKLAATS